MTTLYHIADLGDWERTRDAGEYRWSTRGRDLDQVGFIHCSFDHQVTRVAEFVYRGYGAPLVVLQINGGAVTRAGVEVRSEDGGTGELFPHIYGPIDPEWVVMVHDAGFRCGRFQWGGEPS